jgi:hypothetical protein
MFSFAYKFMKILSLGDPTRFAEVKWSLCGFCMRAFGLAIQIERQETIDPRYYPVGAVVQFSFRWKFQESSFSSFCCLSQETRIFGIVVVE